MKIAVSADGNTLEANVDMLFGRAAYFLIIDTEGGQCEAIDNAQNLNAPQGAGIQSATTVVDAGAKVLITGHCGPKAFSVLKSAGVKIYNTNMKTVKAAMEGYTEGKLSEASSANVEGHWM